jgi:hypothetical protein
MSCSTEQVNARSRKRGRGEEKNAMLRDGMRWGLEGVGFDLSIPTSLVNFQVVPLSQCECKAEERRSEERRGEEKRMGWEEKERDWTGRLGRPALQGGSSTKSPDTT